MNNNNPLEFWNLDTFEISSYFDDSLEKRKNLKTNISTSDKTGLCTYTYNELGYRGDSPKKDGFKIMSIGCSFTECTGVNDWETWPHYFSKLVPNGVDLNFGNPSRSNDYIVRCLHTFYDEIKPDLVLIFYTSFLRREVYSEKGNVEPFMPTSAWDYMKTETGKRVHRNLIENQNDYDDFINNWYKNHLLIKYFLETKKCNWIWNGICTTPHYYEANRFDSNIDYDDVAVDGLHAGPITNKNYAKSLYDFILLNFPKYLPTVKEKAKFI